MNFKSTAAKIINLCLLVFLLLSCGVPEIEVTPIPVVETATPVLTHPTATITNQPVRVLFIGNSFTFFNDLPGMFGKLAQSGGHLVDVDMVAHGGWTCADHANSADTQDAIAQGNWNYVILQEQSQLPAFPDQRREKMYPAIRLLDKKIRESGAKSVLFMTWARKGGLPEHGFLDHFALQDEIGSGYLEIANELDVIVAPVGTAWKNALLQDSQLDLWQADGIHPSQEGTYLAALVFYTVLLQQSPEGISFYAELAEEKAQVFQTVVTKTVLTDHQIWNLP
jgi:hypothetical protein